VSASKPLDVGFVFVDYGDQNMYQLEQWVQSLRRLESRFTARVFYTSPAVTSILAANNLHGVHFEGQEQLVQRLYEFRPRVLLYPNQNIRNFYALRFPEAVHVFVSHGESDKAYMAQNTIKRYDLYFAAGQAARDRIRSNVSNYACDSRIMEIGRPQHLDSYSLPEDLYVSPKRRIVYAPTWEGVTRATRYTSIVSHGKQLVEHLIESGEYQLTYRPHPLSGSRDSEVRRANDAIKKLVRLANRMPNASSAASAPYHYIDSSPFGWQLRYHDLMISDISAIAYDWLSTGKPILLTKPTDKRAVIEEFPLVDKIYSIRADELEDFGALVASQFTEGSELRKVSRDLNRYYFKQPIEESDNSLTQAIQGAIEIQENELASGQFERIKNFESRGKALGWLRYPNYVIRQSLSLIGLWSTSKALEGVHSADSIFVHLSDPFNWISVDPMITELLGSQKSGRTIIISNQVTTMLRVSKIMKSPEFRDLAANVVMVPVANAADCERVIGKLKPREANYLKHHPLNHMLLRLNGLSHVLWRPQVDPLFTPDRSITTYDRIEGCDSETKKYVGKLLSNSRPILN
jgi:hypothetical protein